MKITSKLFVATLLSAATLSAAWGAPCNDANIGRGGYVAYPYGEPQIAPQLTKEQISAFVEQQKAFAEQQARFATQAMETQRQYIEQMMVSQPLQAEPFVGNRMPSEPGFDRGSADIQAERDQMRKQMEAYRQEIAANRPARPDRAEPKARREDMRTQMEVRRAEMLKQIEAQRKEVQQRHAAMHKQVEERRSCREI